MNRDEFLSAKQLAEKLKRDVSWVYAAKRRGFVMPGNRGTLGGLVRWLVKNPPPRGNGAIRKKTQ